MLRLLSHETVEQIKRRALQIAADIEARIGKYSAEIITDVTPQWHLIETLANQELKASEFLVDRHFGVFMPKFEADAIRMLDGINLCSGRRLIFPGHLFVFVWDIEAHWRRIRSCPGVLRVLVDRPEHPVVVPDSAIDFIQALQFGLSPAPKPKRKRYKARQKQQGNEPEACDYVRISTYSALHGIESLDDNGRNGLLHKALGLAS